ncbi:MAG: type II toxin-antitoxin system RelB/DinJ family antitoxin [Oscillospiraceae bacterium]|nr:type II toxin-antitoxin system RelB/DinJ family antitoxin [Oscillospiraceae bacterium]
MGSVNVTFRVDEKIKKQADALFEDMGISLSAALNLFLAQSVREQSLPFAAGKDVPNAITLAAMDAAEQDEDLYGPFDSVEALMEALNA